MPNHLHVLVDFSASSKSINTIVSNGKRFMAYEMVKRLQERKDYSLLNKLQESVTSSDKDTGKKHQIFEKIVRLQTDNIGAFLFRKTELHSQ